MTDKNDYYLKIPSGYKTEIDGCIVEPYIYQPTPKGAKIVADYYNEKYGTSISVVDHTNSDVAANNPLERFKKFSEQLALEEHSLDKPKGFILMHGQNHAIPVLMTREKQEDGPQKDYMVIFDSTSGSSIKGYYNVANMFQDKQVLLNNGTRQADSQSCITDALAILKDASRIKNLGTNLLRKKAFNYEEYDAQKRKDEGRPPNRFKSTKIENDNFLVFNMPGKLCKTAQRSEFLQSSSADMSERVISNKSDSFSLMEKRSSSQSLVSMIGKGNSKDGDINDKTLGINRYLHKKSKRHAEIIDEKLLEMEKEHEIEPKNQSSWQNRLQAGGKDTESQRSIS
jgi:hypothetical protein